MSLVFENRETMRSQIQEMARAERMVSDEQIQTELDVYNALIPEPGELSATLFIELTEERRHAPTGCPGLVGIEHAVVLRSRSGPAGSGGGGPGVTGRARGRPRGGPHPAGDHRLGALHAVRPRPRPGGARSRRAP